MAVGISDDNWIAVASFMLRPNVGGDLSARCSDHNIFDPTLFEHLFNRFAIRLAEAVGQKGLNLEGGLANCEIGALDYLAFQTGCHEI